MGDVGCLVDMICTWDALHMDDVVYATGLISMGGRRRFSWGHNEGIRDDEMIWIQLDESRRCNFLLGKCKMWTWYVPP